jgi:tetratricopeptide (TPR) repeat protein
MINAIQFESLLQRTENETLDFKRSIYNLRDEDSSLDFIKDVCAMANTPRDQTSYIVLGVQKHNDGTNTLWGISEHPDDADLRQAFADRVAPPPTFSYFPVTYDQKQFGVIEIPPERVGPCVPIHEKARKLHRWAIYFRRGSRNEVAQQPDDLARILTWCGKLQVDSQHNSEDPVWDRILQAADRFSQDRYYFLVTTPLLVDSPADLFGLGRIPWTCVVDLDPDSDDTGLLAAIGQQLIQNRSLHRLTMQERATINPRTSVYWYFARGLEGRETSLCRGAWRDWNRTHAAHLTEYIRQMATACLPTPITVIALVYDRSLLRHVTSSLEKIQESFGQVCDIVIITDQPSDIQGVADDLGVPVFGISLQQFCSGIEVTLSHDTPIDPDQVSLPSRSGVQVLLKPELFNPISEEIDIVHLGIGLRRDVDREIGLDFLRGKDISWYDLNVEADARRDLQRSIERQIRVELERRRTSRVNLYHAPGAGGTTLGRRLLWEFHREYPCGILRRTNPPDTADRLYQITSLTERSILLLVDGADIDERQVDDLYNILRSRQIPVTIFQILRRFSVQRETSRAFYLETALTQSEANRFAYIYSLAPNNRSDAVARLLADPNVRFRSAFIFGLSTFEHDFQGLERFVEARIDILTEPQRCILAMLAFAHHYAQQSVPAQAFSELLGFPADKPLQFGLIWPTELVYLVVETSRGLWRTTHDLVAVEILQQYLWPNPRDRRLWRQNLSRFSMEFIDLCRGSSPVPSEELLEIVRRTFIYRDNTELLGTERSETTNFSQLIKDIPSDEGALEVLTRLRNVFPEEPHFHAHLGRYYSNKLKRFREALECVDAALALSDQDSVLHHMRGMVIRKQIYHKIEQTEDLPSITGLVQDATGSFARARELAPDNDHGYISEVQMLAKVVDYAGTRNGGVMKYLSSKDADPVLRDCFERAEDLLEQIRRNREGQGASTYEENCRAQLDALYGRHNEALQAWEKLLGRSDVYRPSIERQIVWTYLARAGRSWSNVKAAEADRMVELLDDCLSYEPYSDANLRLWVQAVRRSSFPLSIDSIIEKVTYWRANSGTQDASYYLYILYSLQAIGGSVLALQNALRFIEESKVKARLRRNRTKSFEWYGSGNGVSALVHHGQLGDWDVDKEFWSNTLPLLRLSGRVSKYDSDQSGEIEVEGGLPAFFVPVRSGFTRSTAINSPVTLYLGFSYDGPRAWDVRPR